MPSVRAASPRSMSAFAATRSVPFAARSAPFVATRATSSPVVLSPLDVLLELFVRQYGRYLLVGRRTKVVHRGPQFLAIHFAALELLTDGVRFAPLFRQDRLKSGDLLVVQLHVGLHARHPFLHETVAVFLRQVMPLARRQATPLRPEPMPLFWRQVMSLALRQAVRPTLIARWMPILLRRGGG